MVDSAEEHITSRCELNKAGRAVCVRLNCSSRLGWGKGGLMLRWVESMSMWVGHRAVFALWLRVAGDSIVDPMID